MFHIFEANNISSSVFGMIQSALNQNCLLCSNSIVVLSRQPYSFLRHLFSVLQLKKLFHFNLNWCKVISPCYPYRKWPFFPVEKGYASFFARNSRIVNRTSFLLPCKFLYIGYVMLLLALVCPIVFNFYFDLFQWKTLSLEANTGEGSWF